MIQYDLYKPNSYNNGCAFSFKIVDQDKQGNKAEPVLMVQAIKQASWDKTKRVGSFSANAKNPEKNIFVKFSISEAGGILDTIETGRPFKAFHSFGEDKTQIAFSTYRKKDETEAFSLSVTKNGSLKFGIGIERGEARALKGLLELYLLKSFSFQK